MWREESGPSAAQFVVSRYESLREELPLTPHRLAILRSFTVEPLVPLLRAGALVNGIDLSVHLSDFNTYAQEMLAPETALYRFEPNAVILAVQTRDAAPDLWQGFTGDETTVDRVLSQFRAWVAAFRTHSQATLIIHNFEMPITPNRGILDGQLATSQILAIERLNAGLRDLAHEHRGVYVLDYDSLVARHGRSAWQDERKWLTMRMPISASRLIDLSREWLRYLHPLTGKIAKALVVDLDNTLWGGVIGEDGMSGIHLSAEYPGASYQALQRAMLDLYHRGILLAIASKNNPADALEALENHSGMLLAPQHFAALRINWNNKAQSLREIAAELNIGLDALAFFDDNPVERDQVREELPEVTVIEVPKNAAEYAQALRDCPVFERLTLSEEDRQRGEYYAAQRKRVEQQQSCSSPEDFYRSLDQEVEISPVSSSTVARVAQLTQKTNQFNLTTRRYTEQEISQTAARSGWQVFALRVRDRHSDNGLVGVAITHERGEATEIEAMLMSCRVIGRTVETAFLHFLAEQARSRGAKRLEGWFLPTKKNAPAQEFYRQHGFRLEREEDGGSFWVLDLTDPLPCPDWIRLVVPEGVHG